MTLANVNLFFVGLTLLHAAITAWRHNRSGTVLAVEAVAIFAVSALCWKVSPDNLLSGIAVMQVRYLFEIAQQLRFSVQRGLLHFAFEVIVLVCIGAELVLLSQTTIGWVEVLCWMLLMSTLIIAAVDPIKRAVALRKDAHWLSKRG